MGKEHRFFMAAILELLKKWYFDRIFFWGAYDMVFAISSTICTRANFDTSYIQFGHTLAIFEGLPTPLVSIAVTRKAVL